jgi:heptaprenyl diphosphate synthase
MKTTRKVDSSFITFMGLLLALSLVLTTIEYLIPPIPMLPPGVKLGLSNIVTMYCLFFLGHKSAFTIVFLKSDFVFLIRGFTSFLMSFTGGILSALVMILIMMLSANQSYIVISIAGAITHNIGQTIVASFILGINFAVAYLPMLLISGVIMGNITGTLLKVVMPAFHVFNKAEPHGIKRRSH